MTGGADNVPDGTVRGTRIPSSVGQAPSHTLLSPFLVVTPEVMPSILPLEGDICAHVHSFCECFTSCWNGREFY